MIHRTFDAELDCPWMTIDVQIAYSFSEIEGTVELESVCIQSFDMYDMTDFFNHDYILDLIHDDMEERS